MITVITGTPGAGKTLYTVSKLLLPLVGATVDVTDDKGEIKKIPRTIYTNIKGLLIDHELIDDGDNQGLRDWHKWAKPGAVIVFDEYQKAWPPRANGSKVPDDIQALDTHRHMGVDFILITQNVMNTDRHVHGLVNRHLHVRRLGNSRMAVVYEWDHCSRALMYSKAFTKSPWRYDKKVFKLYKSAEVHTKQPRKLPGLLWFILVGLGFAAYLGPSTYARLNERIAGKPLAEKVAAAQVEGGAPTITTPAAPATPNPVQAPDAAPAFAGCIASAERCACYDSVGEFVERPTAECRARTRKAAIVLAGGTFPEPPPRPQEEPPTLLLTTINPRTYR
ncbi:hypothetical protein GCM10022279_17880 [Comamonas faecalis]|uniref:Zona occludens toxin N-terminal domain-containing protein n=1 Tax=Comamonas faecalis TaxID=1387849 RepID=A0ABP7RA58_9BURK